MKPRKIPFSDEYVKEQESGLSLGVKLFLIIGSVANATGLALSIVSNANPFWLITLGAIYLLWAAVSRQRLNTLRENLELSKMIRRLNEEE